MDPLVWWTLITAIASALATGLGAVVVFVVQSRSQKVRAFSAAVAAGMMVSASVFSLIREGIDMQTVAGSPIKTVLGLFLGTLFFWGVESYFDEEDEEDSLASLGLDRASLFLFVALFIHSMPEGVAIGVGYATGELRFGIIMATAISIHNIPEGIAMSLPMRADGASFGKCFWFSVLTSVPQPVLAVPALLAFQYFQPWLPVGLGFAAGAMLYVVVSELIPDALNRGGETVTAWGVMIGLMGMLTLTIYLPG
jgi:zinc transporter ZupT